MKTIYKVENWEGRIYNLVKVPRIHVVVGGTVDYIHMEGVTGDVTNPGVDYPRQLYHFNIQIVWIVGWGGGGWYLLLVLSHHCKLQCC